MIGDIGDGRLVGRGAVFDRQFVFVVERIGGGDRELALRRAGDADEQHPVDPVDVNGVAKWAGEKLRADAPGDEDLLYVIEGGHGQRQTGRRDPPRPGRTSRTALAWASTQAATSVGGRATTSRSVAPIVSRMFARLAETNVEP